MRDAYDTVAASYARLLPDLGAEAPLERGMIAQFCVSLPPGPLPVLDAGCGTGRLFPELRELGVEEVIGVDMSEAMIMQARRAYPDVVTQVADLRQLSLGDGRVRGVISWYSLIHHTAAEVADALAEAHRVLTASGSILIGFHAGAGTRVAERAYGHDVSLTVTLHEVRDIVRLLERAGFDIVATAERAAVGRERGPQGFVLARRRSPWDVPASTRG